MQVLVIVVVLLSELSVLHLEVSEEPSHEAVSLVSAGGSATTTDTAALTLIVIRSVLSADGDMELLLLS